MSKLNTIIYLGLAMWLLVGCGGGTTDESNPSEDSSPFDTVTTDSHVFTDSSSEIPPEDASTDSVADTGGENGEDTAVEPPQDTMVEPEPDTNIEPEPDTMVPPPPECEPAATASGSQGHKAGQNCLNCHATMSASRRWTVAGTLYSDAQGSSALSGATITVTDSNGTVIKLVSHSNGNFYTNKTVTFPLSISASKCPDTQVMEDPLTEGGCNGCHTSGSRIHLP